MVHSRTVTAGQRHRQRNAVCRAVKCVVGLNIRHNCRNEIGGADIVVRGQLIDAGKHQAGIHARLARGRSAAGGADVHQWSTDNIGLAAERSARWRC